MPTAQPLADRLFDVVRKSTLGAAIEIDLFLKDGESGTKCSNVGSQGTSLRDGNRPGSQGKRRIGRKIPRAVWRVKMILTIYE